MPGSAYSGGGSSPLRSTFGLRILSSTRSPADSRTPAPRPSMTDRTRTATMGRSRRPPSMPRKSSRSALGSSPQWTSHHAAPLRPSGGGAAPRTRARISAPHWQLLAQAPRLQPPRRLRCWTFWRGGCRRPYTPARSRGLSSQLCAGIVPCSRKNSLIMLESSQTHNG